MVICICFFFEKKKNYRIELEFFIYIFFYVTTINSVFFFTILRSINDRILLKIRTNQIARQGIPREFEFKYISKQVLWEF